MRLDRQQRIISSLVAVALLLIFVWPTLHQASRGTTIKPRPMGIDRTTLVWVPKLPEEVEGPSYIKERTG